MSFNSFYNSLHNLWKNIDTATGGMPGESLQDVARAAKSLSAWGHAKVQAFFSSLNPEQQRHMEELSSVTHNLTRDVYILTKETDVLKLENEIAKLKIQMLEAEKRILGLQNKQLHTLLAEKVPQLERRYTAVITSQDTEIQELRQLLEPAVRHSEELVQQVQLKERQISILTRGQENVLERVDDAIMRIGAFADENEKLRAELAEQQRQIEELQSKLAERESASSQIEKVSAASTRKLMPQDEKMVAELRAKFTPETMKKRVLLAYLDVIRSDPDFMRSLEPPITLKQVREKVTTHYAQWLKTAQKPADMSSGEWNALVDRSMDKPKENLLEAHGFRSPTDFVQGHKTKIVNCIKVKIEEPVVKAYTESLSRDQQFKDMLMASRDSKVLIKEMITGNYTDWLKMSARPENISEDEWLDVVTQAFEKPREDVLGKYGFSSPATFIESYGDKILTELHLEGFQRPGTPREE